MTGHILERDYLLSWILAGIMMNPEYRSGTPPPCFLVPQRPE